MWTDIDTLKLMAAYRNFAKQPWKLGDEIWPSTRPDLNTCDFYLRVMVETELCSKIPRTWDSFSFTNRRQSAVNVSVRWHVSVFCKSGQTTHDNMAHSHCVLNTQVYKHTLRTCNNYCVSSVTMVERTRLDIAWYVICLSFCYVLLILRLHIIL